MERMEKVVYKYHISVSVVTGLDTELVAMLELSWEILALI